MQTDHKIVLRNLSALVDFSNLINSSLDIEFILNNLLLTCFGKFHTSRGAVYLADKSGTLRLSAEKGIKKTHDYIPLNLNIHNYKTDEVFGNYLKENKIVLVQEINSDKDVIGLILLGGRLTGEEYSEDDKDFLQTFLNISATAIQNSTSVSELIDLNKSLDTKVQQLSTLFDLSKEFSSILEISQVSKLLGYSIIGQLLVSKYAVVIINETGFEVLDSKFPQEILEKALSDLDFLTLNSPTSCDETEDKNCQRLSEIGIELIVPMQIKQNTKGLILLGKRIVGGGFSKPDIEFVASLGSLAIISIENSLLFEEALEKQRLEKDLELAKKIQQNLLPSKLPKMKNFEIAAYNRAAKQVGGDYYDAIRLDDSRVLISIGDVSGKGAQAALLMANLQAFQKSISKLNNDLIDASNLLNDLVSENTTDGRFITFFWGILNDETKHFESVNMGHNPPLLIRNNKIQKLKLGGMILGVMPTLIPYKNEVHELQKDDILILFTDGITEAMNSSNQEYSDERLEQLSSELKIDSAGEALKIILDDVKNFTGSTEQSDDITILVVKVN
ncbi:Serine phosphatase RsbU, regulator of sigma subunit [hydrothermal vent metagenome]|uniref:Serine phosphatase RsbU, regulator of sigma subunit n=1 Tax=hydrothermal vent metagenome TaxID=652676 RepID=A0A3B1C4X6_9ZZZZ